MKSWEAELRSLRRQKERWRLIAEANADQLTRHGVPYPRVRMPGESPSTGPGAEIARLQFGLDEARRHATYWRNAYRELNAGALNTQKRKRKQR